MVDKKINTFLFCFAKSIPVEKDIPNKIEKISMFGKFFIFFLNVIAIIYLFDFIYSYD